MSGPSERGSRLRRPLFGRSEVVEEVERALDAAGSPGARAVLVLGGGGSGKTVVLDEAASRAEGRGFQIAAVRAVPQTLAEPFRLARDLIASAGGGEELLPSEIGRASCRERVCSTV